MGQRRNIPRPQWGRGKGEGGKSRGLARGLRRRQTDSERVLWWQLRNRQLHQAKFRRQHPIGPYIVDFCCTTHRLVVEVDGGHHAAQIPADERRTAFLVQRGYRVLRFWDHEVLGNREAVLQAIEYALSHPHPTLSLREGEGKDKAAHTIIQQSIDVLMVHDKTCEATFARNRLARDWLHCP